VMALKATTDIVTKYHVEKGMIDYDLL
jgi:hypothetical protein